MEFIYLACVAFGGTILVLQFMLTSLGLGGDVNDDIGDDTSYSHDSNTFFSVISFKTLIAASAFFGLGGMAASNFPPHITFIVATAVGFGAMYLVAWMMQALHRLRSEGTVRIEGAIGKSGTVYLSVPGQNAGTGKITLNIQNRTMEYKAVTHSPDELPTGANIVVVGIIGPGTVEVTGTPRSERILND